MAKKTATHQDLRRQVTHLTQERDAWRAIGQMLVAKAHGLTEEQAKAFTLPPVEMYESDNTVRDGYRVRSVDEALTQWVLALSNEDPLRQKIKKLADIWDKAYVDTLSAVKVVESLRDVLSDTMPGEPVASDHINVPFTHMELAITITSLRERFPGGSNTADRLRRLLRVAQGDPIDDDPVDDVVPACGNVGPHDRVCIDRQGHGGLHHAVGASWQVFPADEFLVLVHADGPPCHGMRIVDGLCVGCRMSPDTQSTELWPPDEVRVVSTGVVP